MPKSMRNIKTESGEDTCRMLRALSFQKEDKTLAQLQVHTCQNLEPPKPALATAEIAQDNPQQNLSPVSLAVAVKKGATYPLTWALTSMPSFRGPILVLYIKRRTVKLVPTALGPLHISQANESHIKAYMMQIQSQTDQLLNSLKRTCEKYKVVPEFIVIESDELVKKELLNQIAEKRFSHLVIGSSSSSLFKRFKKSTAAFVFNHAPEYCTVTVVSKNYKIIHGKKLDPSISCRLSNVSGDELSIYNNFSTREAINECELREVKTPSHLGSTNTDLASTVPTYPVPSCKPHEFNEIEIEELKTETEEITKIQSEKERMEEEAIQATTIAKEQAEPQAALYCKDLQNAEVAKKALEEISKLKATEKYVEYSYNELRNATKNFSRKAKINEGHSSIIYKGILKCKIVAIKCLKDNVHESQEFQNEVHTLSSLHHPHVLRVLGCCLENHSIIYEHIVNGALQDYLFCTAGQAKLPWYIRFRIAYEVSTAVYFLHTLKPHPIVHQHINPRKILLDKHYGSKLSIGCESVCSQNRSLKACAISSHLDPESQSSGVLSPCLGILMLQLLTGRDDDDIYKIVDHAVDHGSLNDILDLNAGEWPFLEAMEMACLALRCIKRPSSNRPNLEPDILNILEKIKMSGDEYFDNHNSRPHQQTTVEPICPLQFVCPIQQEIMKNPVIAEDGFTYEHEAIKSWLDEHDTSPMTFLELKRKDLIPNLTLRSAIVEWRLSATSKENGSFYVQCLPIKQYDI